MSTSNNTDTSAESTSSNVSKEITVEKDAGKNGTELMKLKESKFDELIDSLKKWDYEAKDTTKENKTEGIEFRHKYPHNCLIHPAYLPHSFWNFKRIWMMAL